MPAKGSGEPPEVRFWRRVDKTAPGGCWLYTGSTATNGYGLFWTAEGTVLAHRFAYEGQVGPIPEGLTIDHLCRVRKCVNAAHLEPVTQRTNNLRSSSPVAQNAAKTHCKRDHPFDEANTYRHAKGRSCRKCRLDSERANAAEINRRHVEYRARKKAERLAEKAA